MRKNFLIFLVLTLPPQAQESPDLESRAKAILAKRCLSCHSAELKTADLVLNGRESALKGGKSGPAFIPNQPEASLLVRKTLDGQMPPGTPLSTEEKETLRAWVAAGAAWSGTLNAGGVSRPRANLDWWSLQPLGQHVPPSPANLPSDWSGAIDRFVFAKLKEKGLDPAPPADRRTLIRCALSQTGPRESGALK